MLDRACQAIRSLPPLPSGTARWSQRGGLACAASSRVTGRTSRSSKSGRPGATRSRTIPYDEVLIATVSRIANRQIQIDVLAIGWCGQLELEFLPCRQRTDGLDPRFWPANLADVSDTREPPQRLLPLWRSPLPTPAPRSVSRPANVSASRRAEVTVSLVPGPQSRFDPSTTSATIGRSTWRSDHVHGQQPQELRYPWKVSRVRPGSRGDTSPAADVPLCWCRTRYLEG